MSSKHPSGASSTSPKYFRNRGKIFVGIKAARARFPIRPKCQTRRKIPHRNSKQTKYSFRRGAVLQINLSFFCRAHKEN